MRSKIIDHTSFPVDHTSKETILRDVDAIAQHILNFKLLVGDTCYRVNELEFYIKTIDEDVFNDPYTYGHPLQLQTGKMYAHASGIDLTFGNENIHIGVLLRGIGRLKDDFSSETDHEINEKYYLEKIISGPHKVATELISNLSFTNCIALNLSQNENFMGDAEPFILIAQTKRHGLSKKDEFFYNLPLRYIGFYPLELVNSVNNNKNYTLHNRERIVIEAIKQMDVNKQELVKTILGYIPTELK